MSLLVENWVGRLKPATGKMARTHLGLFMRWVKINGGTFKDYTPDQLIEYQKNADNGHRYEVLDLLQRYILSLKGRRNTKTSRYTYARSFFMHNRAELPRDRSFRIRGDESTVRGDLTVEEAKKIILASNPMFQAVYLCMLQGGMGSHEILYWSNHGLEKLKEDLRGSSDIIKVDLPGRKMGEYERPYYTFLGGDALVALRKWMTQRPEDSKAIFVTGRGAPVNYFSTQAYWRRHMFRLGIGPRNLGPRKGRTGKSPHELRDLFRSQWAKSPASPEVAEYCMGHVIDVLDYNKSWRDVKFYQRGYAKALPFLEIMSSPRPFGQVDEEEVETLRKEVKQLRETMDSRSESDRVMDAMIKDPQFVEAIKQTLKKLQQI